MSDSVRIAFVHLTYILSASLFVFGLKRMSRVKTARQGNTMGAIAMALAVLATLVDLGRIDYRWIVIGMIVGTLIGAFVAIRVPMTSMPEMVALLNGFGGAASTLVAMALYWWVIVEKNTQGTYASINGHADAITTVLTIIVGAVTLSGSLVAYLKLKGTMTGNPVLLPARHVINISLGVAALALGGYWAYGASTPGAGEIAVITLAVLSLVVGVLLVIPIGGADMPVVVSLLNSYSGVAGCLAGFVIGNMVLIISGAMVGAAGLILTQIMCKAMNRSLASVVLGGFGGDTAAAGAGGKGSEYTNVRSAGAEEVAMTLGDASSVMVVPGYGLAVAQAQHTVRELADLLEKRGAKVQYAIHPVAGRMPGHMNVLLAEAEIPYESLIEMDPANSDMKNVDVVLVLGANDVVNPAALTNKQSPIYGMPIIEVHHAKSVFVVKRSLGSGYAGVKNDLFEYPNTMMVFGDAKKVLQDLVNELKQL